MSSPDFAPEGWIPDRCAGYGEDASPTLCLEGLAEKTVSMAVTLDDLDHPIQPGYNHWVAWNIPPLTRLPGGLPRGASVTEPIPMCQGMAYGRHVYRGPKPPFRWKHRYCFTVYTLDTRLSIEEDADKKALLTAMAGHVLQTACLYGQYQRCHGDTT